MINFHEIWICFCKSLYTKICGLMLDSSERDTSKCWTFVFIYVPLSKSLCDNTNVITRTDFITGFEQRPTASKFCTVILERVFEEYSKIFFQKCPNFFFKYFSKKKILNFVQEFFFYFTISFIRMIPYLSIFLLFKRSPFHIVIFVSFVAMLQFKVCLSIWMFVWAINVVVNVTINSDLNLK